MAFSSQMDANKEHCDSNFSTSARLHTTDDYFLDAFLDFPQFSPEVLSDSLYSLKTDADCWENANQISKSTECNNSINKMNNASVGSICFADPYPEVATNRDRDVPLHDMSLSDDLSSLVFNASTFDAFDYIEESESSISRCVVSDFQCSKFSSSSQCFDYIGGCTEDINDKSDCQGDSELENCYAEQLPAINCCNWPTDNIDMNLTSSQSNRWQTDNIDMTLTSSQSNKWQTDNIDMNLTSSQSNRWQTDNIDMNLTSSQSNRWQTDNVDMNLTSSQSNRWQTDNIDMNLTSSQSNRRQTDNIHMKFTSSQSNRWQTDNIDMNLTSSQSNRWQTDNTDMNLTSSQSNRWQTDNIDMTLTSSQSNRWQTDNIDMNLTSQSNSWQIDNIDMTLTSSQSNRWQTDNIDMNLTSSQSNRWQTDNIDMNLTSSQSNRFETVNETVLNEQANTHAENEETIWSNWSVVTLEYDKDISKGQSYGTNVFSANTVMSVPKANVGACNSSQNNVCIAHLDNTSTPLTEVIECKSDNSNQMSIPPDTRSIDNTQLVQNNGQSVQQREQTELPFSANMTVDLWNAGSHCYELKNAMPISKRMNTDSECECTVYTEQPPSESINSSNLSDLQANRENNIHCLARQSETYMKVGKRGRYVALPVKNVNKLMVRELLCISGNKEEISIRDTTRDYRNNIRRIIEQKHKRLNHLEC